MLSYFEKLFEENAEKKWVLLTSSVLGISKRGVSTLLTGC